MFFRRKTKENHAKSVQNVRKLLFSLGKTKEKQKKDTPPQKKKDPPKKSTPQKLHSSDMLSVRQRFPSVLRTHWLR